MIILICKNCSKEYSVQNYRKYKSKHCSRKCHNIVAGKLGGIAGKGVSRGKGIKRPYLSERNKIITYKGDSNGSWKGDGACYSSIHIYVRYHYGKPSLCEHCGSTSNIHWANKSGAYLREDRNDWLQLCCKCHHIYDKVTMKNVPKRFENHIVNLNYKK